MISDRFFVYLYNGWGEGAWGESRVNVNNALINARQTWDDAFAGRTPTAYVIVKPGDEFPPPVIRPRKGV